MKCPYCIKVCTKCNRILVAYNGNFRKEKRGKWGLHANCKQCDKKYYEENKEEIREHRRKYYEENKEQIAKYHKQWYEENKEQILECKKQWYEENKEQILECNRQYYKSNPDKVLNYNNNRRLKEKNQGRGITKEQWYEMMCWFDWCCAYSGEYLGDKGNKNKSIDHVVPLNKGGLNEPWNCVPMIRNYNSSKYAKDMETWYIQQDFFSEERLQRIYEWCKYAWNKWGYEE